jgi:hypothetical protein
MLVLGQRAATNPSAGGPAINSNERIKMSSSR